MKIIKSSVEILPQKPGVEGMYRLIERVARCSYKSEDKISEDSYKKFNEMIYNRGHWAVFNLGTVYLKVPNRDHCPELLTLISRPYNAWTKWEEKDEMFYVTTNYRVICQAGLQEFMEKYWCEPTEYHYHRVTTHWICSRSIGNELVRHRSMSFCLSGDSVIRSYRQKEWTIKTLYDWQFDEKRKGRLKLINVRSVDENDHTVIKNTIDKIIKTGIKKTYKVTTQSGRTVSTTLEHKFYTPDGYKELKNLKPGDYIYANGIELLENESWLREMYLEKNMTRRDLAKKIGCGESTLYKAFKKFNIIKPWTDLPNRKPGYGKKGMFSEEQRKEISERMSFEGNHQWKGAKTEVAARDLSRRHYKKDHCEFCGTTENLEQHHWDKNPLNWKEDNVITLCTKCHNLVHKSGTLGVFKDKIVSIEFDKEEEVYDIVMKEEPHNFVVNGLVVHNCQESTRYILYSRQKFGGELTYILPQWVYRVRDNIANTIDSLTGESREYIKDLDGQELWDTLCCYDRTVASRDRLWEAAEEEYIYEVITDEGEKLKAEEARDSLPLGLKTEICMTGFVEDFYYVPKSDTKEKAGFFFLRSANDAHPDIKVLSDSLMKQFEEKGIDKLK